MASILVVPPDRVETILAFVRSENIPVQIVGADQTDVAGSYPVRVVSASAGVQSSAAALQAGGWIACATAFEAARRLGLTPAQLGKLLDHLDIRIRACQLGCFE